MDGTIQEPDKLPSPGSPVAGERQAQLTAVVGALEEALKMLEGMELTLPVALLDHAIAETRRHLTP